MKKDKGITLIALIVMIIVLLILAGVSIVMLTSDNGIIKQAIQAKERTEISSEREAIELILINREMDKHNEKYNIGEELKDRTLANGDNWKIVSVNSSNKIYGTGYYFVGEGVDLDNYGKTKHNWIINYDEGEVIELTEGDFAKLKYGDNLAVTDNLILNVDPINMSDENSWGEGVTVYGIEEGDGYGWNKTEFKLDGVDDYIEVYTQDIPMEEGFTFEFFGKSDKNTSEKVILCKTNEEKQGLRTSIRNINELWMSMGGENSDSTWSETLPDNSKHWIYKKTNLDFASSDGGYISIKVNLKENEISVFTNGEFLDSTICSENWLNGSQITSSDVPFLIGKILRYDVDAGIVEGYSKINLYACRLYNSLLTDEEIKANYDKTVAYHNMLVQTQK